MLLLQEYFDLLRLYAKMFPKSRTNTKIVTSELCCYKTVKLYMAGTLMYVLKIVTVWILNAKDLFLIIPILKNSIKLIMLEILEDIED